MKFVYALISSGKDYYTEQAVISMHSLRLHNPDCHITLVTDEATLNTFTDNRSLIKNYVTEMITLDVPADFTPTQKSRYIKTSLRQNVKGDFMYLDNDTVVTASLAELQQLECEMGAILDCHGMAGRNGQLKQYLEHTGKAFWNYDYYFNGGVWYVKDTERVHRFFRDWHRIWDEERVKYGLSIDQPAFAQANVANDFLITEISGIYNCQIVASGSKKIICKAKVLHYFSEIKTDYFPLKEERILKSVRDTGINDEVAYIIENPLTALLVKSRLLGGEELRIYDSPIVILARKLSRDCRWTNRIAQCIYGLFGYRI